MSNLFNSEMMGSFEHSCAVLEKTWGPDGLGGTATTWRQGMEFKGYFEDDTSTAANIAGQQGYNATYRVYVDRNMKLDLGDVFIRKSDGRKYRVNRPSPDKKTPMTSAMSLRLILCEKWEYPTDVPDSSST